MNITPTLTAAEELDEWEKLAQMDDCISSGRFVPGDLRAMVKRLRKAEAALGKIAEARVHGTPDRTSAAQVEAMIDIAKAGLSSEAEDAAQVQTGYTGPINPGMRFVWEPNNPRARCVIKVERMVIKHGGENRIYTSVVGSSDDPVWNEESRFREAVIPIAPIDLSPT